MAQFEADYFQGGTVSNYTDYAKRRYPVLCQDLIDELQMDKKDAILDAGCATGALLWEFKKKDFTNIKGMDESLWAVMKGRNIFKLGNIIEHYNRNLYEEFEWDWVFFLDVLEHMDDDELEKVIFLLRHNPPRKGIVVRIPVSIEEGQDFVLEVSKRDKTHIQIHAKQFWKNLFTQNGFKIYKRFMTPNIYESEGVAAWWLKKS